jgi:hypothetical protein
MYCGVSSLQVGYYKLMLIYGNINDGLEIRC